MEIAKYKGYSIFVSDKKDKKYYAKVGNRKVYFGDTKYQHYQDKIGHYSHLDHGDSQRRKNFKSRHENNRHKIGSAAFFSDSLLW